MRLPTARRFVAVTWQNGGVVNLEITSDCRHFNTIAAEYETVSVAFVPL